MTRKILMTSDDTLIDHPTEIASDQADDHRQERCQNAQPKTPPASSCVCRRSPGQTHPGRSGWCPSSASSMVATRISGPNACGSWRTSSGPKIARKTKKPRFPRPMRILTERKSEKLAGGIAFSFLSSSAPRLHPPKRKPSLAQHRQRDARPLFNGHLPPYLSCRTRGSSTT